MNTNITLSTSKKGLKFLGAVEDRLSDLPDNLLLYILSFLPTTEQVIRTCLLSTRWKYIWISIPNLYFPAHKKFRDIIGDKHKVLLVDKVLSLHDSSNIQKFHLHLDDDNPSSSSLEAWISTLMKHRLQDFYLSCVAYPGFFRFSFSLFESLKLLKVRIPCFLPLPSSICFPNLKVLEFGKVKFSVELSTPHQHDVFFTFPLLEDFEMWSCEWLEIKTVSIYAPSLVKLRVSEAGTKSDHFSTKIDIDAPRLVKLSFEENLYHDYHLNYLPSLDIATFLTSDNVFHTHCLVNWCTAVSNVRHLELCACCIKTFSDTGYLTNTEMFSNVIFFNVMSSCCAYSGEYLINLLDRMPNVESLKIDLYLGLSDGDQWSKRTWMKEQVSRCNLSKLKSVDVVDFDGSDNALYLVSYLLARTLEEMTIHFHSEYFADDKNENDILKWLLRLPRGSPGTKVIILDY